MTKSKRVDCSSFLKLAASDELFISIINKINLGAVFVYPTETIYGIGGIDNPVVEKKIYRAKKRRPDNPLLLIGSNLAQFDYLNLNFSETANRLAEKFWPGNLTLILSKNDNSNEKIGIRVSNHPLVQKIMPYLKTPLFSTSANISGEEYKSDSEIIYKTFENSTDFMFDFGKLRISQSSTVIDVSIDGKVHIIREGVIRTEDIEKLLR